MKYRIEEILYAAYHAVYLPFLYLEQGVPKALSSDREKLVLERSELVSVLIGTAEKERRNILYHNGSNLTFAVIYIQESGDLVLLGGFFLEDRLRKKESQELFISGKISVSEAEDYFHALPVLGKKEYIKILNWLNRIFNQRDFFLEYKKFPENTGKSDLQTERIDLKQVREREFKHTAYQFEQKMLSYIRSGNTVLLKQLLGQTEDLVVADLAVSKNVERNIKNQMICACTLASRATMEGGLAPEIAYSISDDYINFFERSNDISKMGEKNHEMLLAFTEKVARLGKLQARSKVVSQAVLYVNENITRPLNVEIVSLGLGISRDYLSEIFKKETGSSLIAYIQKRKVEEAQMMLRYSDASIVEISEALSFSSQSYFTQVFKRYTSMTPLDYRNQMEQH